MNASAWLLERATPEPNSGCWLWLGATYRNGYGHCKVPHSRRTIGAHRMAYILTHGGVPEGMDVCHKCDTRSCVNPTHLFIGTRSENILDCLSKGRFFKGIAKSRMMAGENAPMAKLTWADVHEIRGLFASGESQNKIAARFGVSHRTISLIVRGQSWRVEFDPEASHDE